jgi:enamine deaminase RidA (YjgF/YER057c/UK114 family)
MNDATRSNVPHVETIQPNPARAKEMPYAPAVRIVGACDLMFVSGVTPSPLYHMHPHIDSEHQHPIDIGEQTKRAMAGAKEVLDSVGASWTDVVKITKYLTDIRDADGMHAAMRPFFGDWKPASTMICINQLSSPGARVELDMIVALPKSAAK